MLSMLQKTSLQMENDIKKVKNLPIPPIVFRFYFILFYFYIFISNVSKYMASRSNQKCLTTIHAVLYIRMIFIINL